MPPTPSLRFRADDGTKFPDWEAMTLGDIGRVHSFARVRKEQTTPHGDVPFVKAKNLDSPPDAFITKELYEELKATHPFPKLGAILFSTAGTISRVHQYQGEDAYYQDCNMVWLEHDATVCDEFLKYFYTVAKWQDPRGTVTPYLSYHNIQATIFNRPTIPEQHKIAAILNAIDEITNSTTKEITALQHYQQGLLHCLLTKERRFKQANGDPFPEWTSKTTTELCSSMVSGDTPDPKNPSYYQGTIPWITAGDVDKGDIFTVRHNKFITEEAIAHSLTKKVKAGSIALVLRVVPGKVAILERTTCTSNSFVCLEEPTADRAFLAYLLAHRMKKEAHYAEGTAQKSIKLQHFQNLKHQLPASKEEQHQIASLLTTIDELTAHSKTELSAWQALKSGLLQQLFP